MQPRTNGMKHIAVSRESSMTSHHVKINRSVEMIVRIHYSWALEKQGRAEEANAQSIEIRNYFDEADRQISRMLGWMPVCWRLGRLWPGKSLRCVWIW